jgi:hypothetical protein
MVGPASLTPATDTVRLLLLDGRVQTLPMEEYLRGVVPAEMSPGWPLEALKAQAIASRSYATYAHNYPRHPDQGADLCTTTHCQAYRSELVGKYATADQAVYETRGVIILYRGQIINAFYSANCGGHTLANEEGFRNPETGFTPPPVPYLRGVTCPNPGPKSGHGVGMCQCGANDMAVGGKAHREILTHYYTGVELTSGEPWTEVKTAVIEGTVRDEAGAPLSNVQVALQGILAATGAPASALFTTDAEGAFHFGGLDIGDYNISLVGTKVKRGGLLIEGPEELALDLTLPGLVTGAWQKDIQQSSGLPLLVGSLPGAGIIMTVEDPVGEQVTAISGSWREYGPGGFRIWLRHSGLHRIRFFDQVFEVEAGGNTTLVTFQEGEAEPHSGAIAGRVVDSNGLPQPGRKLLLSGPPVAGVRPAEDEQLTDQDGFYCFDNLPPGEFTVRLEGTSLERSGLLGDGQQTIPADFALPPAEPQEPTVAPWTVTLKRMTGLRLLIGILPEAGIEVTITGPGGHQVKVLSGSKLEYGPGAFEIPAWSRGTFVVAFLDQSFPIEIADDLVVATFSRETAPPSATLQARLASAWMALSQAESWLSFFAAAEYGGLFTLERWAEALPSSEPTPGWTMTVERKPGLPLLVGRLPKAGIQVAVEDPYGNRVVVISGSKPEYGPGAFEVPAWIHQGNYTVRFLDQSFPVEMRGDFVTATFAQGTEEQARLVSAWMTEGEAQTWQTRLEGQERTKGLFTMERKSP